METKSKQTPNSEVLIQFDIDTYDRLDKEYSLAKEKINNRVLYIVNTISKICKLTKPWAYDAEIEFEIKNGKVEHWAHMYRKGAYSYSNIQTGNIKDKYSFNIADKSGNKINLLKFFPYKWLFEDFKPELNDMVKVFFDKEKEQTKKKTLKGKALKIQNAKKKLTTEEKQLLGIK